MDTSEQTPTLPAAANDEVPVWLHVVFAVFFLAMRHAPDVVIGVDRFIIGSVLAVIYALIGGAVVHGCRVLSKYKNARYSRAFVLALWVVVTSMVLASWV